MVIPDFLTHYYENSAGPFSNLSMLPLEQADNLSPISKSIARASWLTIRGFGRLKLFLNNDENKLSKEAGLK